MSEAGGSDTISTSSVQSQSYQLRFLLLLSASLLLTQTSVFAAPGPAPDDNYVAYLKKQRDGWLWETPGNAIVWKAFIDQADACGKSKDFAKQLALLEAAVEHSSCFKDDDPRRVETIKKLAACAKKQGKVIQEKDVQQLILPVTSTHSHPKYRMKPAPRTKAYRDVEPMIQEADHLVVDGDTDRAVSVYRKTLKNLHERTNRKGHEIVQVVDRLTRIYYKQGRFTEAEELVRKELKAMESMHDRLDDFDPERLQLAFLLGDLALVYSGQERLIEAEALYKTALKIVHQHLSEHHYDYIITLSELARIHKLMGKYSESEKEYQSALALSKNQSDCSRATRSVIFANYGKLLKKMGKDRKATEMEAQARILAGATAHGVINSSH